MSNEKSLPPQKAPCLLCGKELELASHGGVFSWVWGGIWLLETGNYGSTVLDDPPGHLAAFMVLCDECLLRHRDRIKGVRLTPGPGRPFEGARWLDDVPEELIAKVEVPGGSTSCLPGSFWCPVCNATIVGGTVISATCGAHGQMRNRLAENAP